MKKIIIAFPIVFILFTISSCGQKKVDNSAPLSGSAPIDKPISVYSSTDSTVRLKLRKIDSLIAPPVKLARKALPDARKRYENGLNNGEAFFLTMRVFRKDSSDFEQIFVRVKTWNYDTIMGTIADQMNVVTDYKMGQMIKFNEKDVLDWLISKPDGKEEGNYVGKYLDSINSNRR